jgi:hypothetical protein
VIGPRTDKRDAIRLARLFAAGDLRLVWVPSEEHEQLRDLVRCREDLRADLMRARHRLQTFLLRRERYFPGPGGRWMLKHRHWLSQQQFDDAARAPAPRRIGDLEMKILAISTITSDPTP